MSSPSCWNILATSRRKWAGRTEPTSGTPKRWKFIGNSPKLCRFYGVIKGVPVMGAADADRTGPAALWRAIRDALTLTSPTP